MSPPLALATAVTYVWLGMVTAISFLEAPLKFRAPGVTLQIGLGIGRLVFRALNIAEFILAVALASAVVAATPTARISLGALALIVILVVQVVLVRPHLTRRSDHVLAGKNAARSNAHYWYVGLEAVKVVALLVTGAFLLSA